MNRLTGNDLDFRSGTFAKAQALFAPAQNWEARVIYTFERNRDGDFALGDLGAIRQDPFHVSRNYEGFTNRAINNTTVRLRGDGERVAIDATTGFVSWKTHDSTDLDYTPLPLATRDNREESFQFTQEVRAKRVRTAPADLVKSFAALGKPPVFTQASPAPDGQHILVTRLKRPYSYLRTLGFFECKKMSCGKLLNALENCPG